MTASAVKPVRCEGPRLPDKALATGWVAWFRERVAWCRWERLCVPGLLLATLCCLVSGCGSIGPATVRRDRLHYASAIADSWKEQLLLNIVKSRYGDPPVFLEVSSLVAGYTLETGVSINGEYYPVKPGADSFIGGEVSGKFTDRPTISYLPMTGDKFARSLLAPVPLDAVWAVIQGGVPADFLLGLTLQAMEGYRNMGLYAGQSHPADPEFGRILHLLRSIQQSHALDSDLVKQSDRTEVWVTFPGPHSTPGPVAEQIAEVKALLHIPGATNRVRIAYGTRAANSGVVGLRTRSLMQILSTLGAGVEIPAEHLTEGGVVRLDPDQRPPGFIVRSGREKPAEPFVAVPYAGQWFWIERQDLASKTTLATVTVLFNFLEGGGSKAAPVLTIPTQ